jgi:hypothetical protein
MAAVTSALCQWQTSNEKKLLSIVEDDQFFRESKKVREISGLQHPGFCLCGRFPPVASS